MSTETISQLFNQSVWSNYWIRTSTLSQWELKNGIHGIILNWQELSPIITFMLEWLIWSETEILVRSLLQKLKKFVVMLILLKKSWTVSRTQWVKKSPILIFNALDNFKKKHLTCSNSEKKSKDIWKIEWKSSHPILLNLSEKPLLLNLLLTPELWQLWLNIQLQPSKF